MLPWGPVVAADVVASSRVLLLESATPTVATVLETRPVLGGGFVELLTEHGIRTLDRNSTVWATVPAKVPA